MASGVTSNIKASAEIIATNKVATNANIKYDAGQEIQLLPGFNAENGSVFLQKFKGVIPQMEMCPERYRNRTQHFYLRR